MKPRIVSLVSLGTGMLCLGLLSACVVVPADPYRQGGGEAYPSAGTYVDVAPPAPRYEVAPAMPYAGAIWIGGYWGWHGHRHVWSPGYWSRPQHGRTWVPHRWHSSPRGWVLQGGRWH